MKQETQNGDHSTVKDSETNPELVIGGITAGITIVFFILSYVFVDKSHHNTLGFGLYWATLLHGVIIGFLVASRHFFEKKQYYRAYRFIVYGGAYLLVSTIVYARIPPQEIANVKEPTKLCSCSETSASPPESSPSE